MTQSSVAVSLDGQAWVVLNASPDIRSRTAFNLWSCAETGAVLAAFPVFGVLAEGVVTRREMRLDTGFQPLPGLTITPFAVPGKVALFLEAAMGAGHRPGGQSLGLEIAGGGKRTFHVPACASVPDWLLARADLVLFDGTVFADDEMAIAGVGAKTGARTGHVAISGPEGMPARLKGALPGRKMLIHINNTNPILQPDSPERAAVQAAGWEVAMDGMEVRP